MVTATGQNRLSSIVILIVMPIVMPIATPTVALTIIMLIKRPLKYDFIRIKTIY